MSRSTAEEPSLHSPRRELVILLILAAVQFITIVDFMIVMPLGPKLMETLQITPAQFGVIVSSYTFAAGFTGLVASSIIDRFSRRTTFLTLYGGFLLGTLFCAFAPNYYSLVAARILTGAFGGILGGMALAIVGDVFPEHRRGRATGSLMLGFSLASVAGVPLGLVLGTNFGWHVPFWSLVLLGLPVFVAAPFALPPLNAHIGKKHAHPLRSVVETFTQRNHLNSFALMATLMIGSFAVFPYLPDYLVKNVGVTDEQLPFPYIAGGLLTLITAPLIGKLADRYGKLLTFRVVVPGSIVLILVITHLPVTPVPLVVAIFGALMVFNSGRMIPAMAMVTSSVESHRRGAFLSANSSMQHVAAGVGASLGGAMITKMPAGQLGHFGAVGWVAAVFTLLSLWLAGRVKIVDAKPATAESISLVAAAEANVDVGEPLVDCAEAT